MLFFTGFADFLAEEPILRELPPDDVVEIEDDDCFLEGVNFGG